MAPLGMCEGWLDVDTVEFCVPEDFPTGRLARAVDAATGLMHAALGRRWPGTCTDEIRPGGGGWGVQWVDYPAGGARPLVLAPTGCRSIPCGGLHEAIRLPNGPVIVDPATGLLDGGEVLDSGNTVVDYVVVDDHYLVRRGGWRCGQRLDLEPTEPGTLQVRYRWGALPPAEVLAATETLACELARAWGGSDDCRLPKRLTNVVREGLAMTVLDNFDWIRDGGFGIAEVDYVVRTHNPERLDRPAKLVDPQAVAAGTGTHRVR